MENTEDGSASQELPPTIDSLSQALQELWRRFDALRAEHRLLEEQVVELHGLVHGRNRSAPTKRNMTDHDAMAVLTGSWKDLAHKEAAESAGLTYAQVYSARLEFTFKHVHKVLRDGGWKNPWARTDPKRPY